MVHMVGFKSGLAGYKVYGVAADSPSQQKGVPKRSSFKGFTTGFIRPLQLRS